VIYHEIVVDLNLYSFFFCFILIQGTEKEIKAALRTIEEERQQRRQSLHNEVLNQQRQADAEASRYSKQRSSSSSSFSWPASPAQQPSLAARFFGNTTATASHTRRDIDGSGSSRLGSVMQGPRLSSSARGSLDSATPMETKSPLPSAAADNWAHAVSVKYSRYEIRFRKKRKSFLRMLGEVNDK